MKTYQIFFLLIIMFAILGCSKNSSTPISPGTYSGTGSHDSSGLFPIAEFDGSSALGLLGAYNLDISSDGSSADLVPMRSSTLGEAYIVSGKSYFTSTRCSDCLKVKGIRVEPDGNATLVFSIKHPFSKGDPGKPPSAINRLDLDIFDVALLIVPQAKTADIYPQTGSNIYTDVILNADGCTTELANLINDNSAIPYKICYESQNNNRFEMGNDYKDFDVIFPKDVNLSFNLYITFGYGVSAKKAQRLNPTYYVPEFNRKAAWKVDVAPQTWVQDTPSTVTIDIYDWNHGAKVASNFPDPVHTNYISAPSDVQSVTVEVPSMTNSIVNAITSDTTLNGWDDPLTYTATFSNEKGLASGVYTGLVKIIDSRNPGSINDRDKTDILLDSPDGYSKNWLEMPEISTYQTFTALIDFETECGEIEPAGSYNVARFGYFWKDQSLPYDTELTYQYDMAVYPDGIFADECDHQFAYVTSQNKHIIYNSVPYSVEIVGQYGYGIDNAQSIKRIWLSGYYDSSRYTSWWIDSDADGIDWWDLQTLADEGYFTDVDSTKFLRVRIQTISISEQASPPSSTWENRIYFYNFTQSNWILKGSCSFTIPASRQDVRNSTYSTGGGIWSCILETYCDQPGLPGSGAPPLKPVTFKNRSVHVVDGGIATDPPLSATNNNWIEPDFPYTLFDRSMPTFENFSAGS